MTCRDLEQLITPFVDDECSPADRSGILAHLRQCPECRTRVEAESTARHVLHAHAAIARTMGVSPAWRPRVIRLGKPTLPVHPTLLVVLVIVGAGLIGMWLRPTPVLAIGVIGDSVCGHRHHPGRPNADDRECTLGCVRRGAEFVLVTDTQIYRIHNQQLPELSAFANRRVKVEGRVEDGRILVGKMTVVEDGAGPSATRVQ